MSEMLTPDHSPQDMQSPAGKPQRVLACLLCQQRKVRCDRKFPCANCTKASVQCTSAALIPRQRRRRFPEKDLLDRLRHYEDLLRRHHIPFEPLHSSAAVASKGNDTSSHRVEARVQIAHTEPSAAEPTTSYKVTNFWHAMNRKSQHPANDDETKEADIDNDDDEDSDSSTYLIREKVVKNAWESFFASNETMLFCSRNTNIDLAALHPNQIHIFKIWQVYLDNFNPLLKVTHTPTLQARIIDAAGDTANIDPPLEALMFSIYCVAIFSLEQAECQKMFAASKEELLSNFQLGAREALLNCRFLRTDSRECLTALYLYLITTRLATDPRSLSSMLGVAIRIAQRLGIHDENANSKHDALEAELRRRLWWSLVLFDSRISEFTDFRLGLLLPTWDCKLPLNANDLDLRPGMRTLPEIHGVNSENLFALVRSEFGDFLRHYPFYLDFVNPALKSVARLRPVSEPNSEADAIDALERNIEDKYLHYCDPQNPLHFMTIWWARGQIAKSRFIKHLAECSKSPAEQTIAQRDAGISYALTMLECDTKVLLSNHTKGFRWMISLNFPFPAYVHVVQDLRERPLSAHGEAAWNIMGENCEARFTGDEGKTKFMDQKRNPFFKIFTGVVFQAWTARTEALANLNSSVVEPPPKIIMQINARLAQIEAKFGNEEGRDQDGGEQLDNDGLPISMGDIGPSYNSEQGFVNMDPGTFTAIPEQMSMGFDTHSWGWPVAPFHPMLRHGW